VAFFLLLLSSITAMPFLDLQKRLGISLDRHLLIQNAEQPFKIPTLCQAFEKEWIECAHGIGGIRAQKECSIELDDFKECLLRQKTVRQYGGWIASLSFQATLLSVLNWLLDSGFPNVNWQNLCGEALSLLKCPGI
jgi:NADH dehydrogenase (ubiquinone) Fe-S protein 5